MQVEWYGQFAFRLSDRERTVVIDPFGDVSALASRGIRFDYPAISAAADLVLVTHEHVDHNRVEAVDGDPAVLRSTAGRLESPAGQVLAVASEHDAAAGTVRGPNSIFVFELDGIRTCHFGDFGQAALRDEQAKAIGRVDLLIIPVGAGPTIGPGTAAEITARLEPRWVVPMHYRTARVNFLEGVEPFLERSAAVTRIEGPRFDTAEIGGRSRTVAVVAAAP
jgi:L-ascorbate metabolism protein UlaG (beta-lactamase superfamily)